MQTSAINIIMIVLASHLYTVETGIVGRHGAPGQQTFSLVFNNLNRIQNNFLWVLFFV